MDDRPYLLAIFLVVTTAYRSRARTRGRCVTPDCSIAGRQIRSLCSRLSDLSHSTPLSLGLRGSLGLQQFLVQRDIDRQTNRQTDR